MDTKMIPSPGTELRYGRVPEAMRAEAPLPGS